MALNSKQSFAWLEEALAQSAQLVWPVAEFGSAKRDAPYLMVPEGEYAPPEAIFSEKEQTTNDSGEVVFHYRLSDDRQEEVGRYFDQTQSSVGEHHADHIFDPSIIKAFMDRYGAQLCRDENGDIYCAFSEDDKDEVDLIISGKYGRVFDDYHVLQLDKNEQRYYFRFYPEAWRACTRYQSEWQDKTVPLPQQELSDEFVKARALKKLLDEYQKEGAFLASMHRFIAPEDEQQAGELRTGKSDEAFFYLPETNENSRKIQLLRSQRTGLQKEKLFSSYRICEHEGQAVYRFKVKKEHLRNLLHYYPDIGELIKRRDVLQAPEFFDLKLPADTTVALHDREDGSTILMLRAPHANGGSTTVENKLKSAGLIRDDLPRPNIEMATDQTYHGGVVASVLIPTVMADAIRRAGSEYIQDCKPNQQLHTLAEAQQWAMRYLKAIEREHIENGHSNGKKDKAPTIKPKEPDTKPLAHFLGMLEPGEIIFHKETRLDGNYDYAIQLDLSRREKIGGQKIQDWCEAISGDSATLVAAPVIRESDPDRYPIRDPKLYYQIQKQINESLGEEAVVEVSTPIRFPDRLRELDVKGEQVETRSHNNKRILRPAKAVLQKIYFAPANDQSVTIYFEANRAEWFKLALPRMTGSMRASDKAIDAKSITSLKEKPAIARITVGKDVADELWESEILSELNAEALDIAPQDVDKLDALMIERIGPKEPQAKTKDQPDKGDDKAKKTKDPVDQAQAIQRQESEFVRDFANWAAEEEEINGITYWSVGFERRERDIEVPKTDKEIEREAATIRKRNATNKQRQDEKIQAIKPNKTVKQPYVQPVLYFAMSESNHQADRLKKNYPLVDKHSGPFKHYKSLPVAGNRYKVRSVGLSPAMLESIREKYPHGVKELGQQLTLDAYDPSHDADETVLEQLMLAGKEAKKTTPLHTVFKKAFKEEFEVEKEERSPEQIAYDALASSRLIRTTVQLYNDEEIREERARNKGLTRSLDQNSKISERLRRQQGYHAELLETGKSHLSGSHEATKGIYAGLKQAASMIDANFAAQRRRVREGNAYLNAVQQVPFSQRQMPALIIVDPPSNMEEKLAPIEGQLALKYMKRNPGAAGDDRDVLVIYPDVELFNRLHQAVKEKVSKDVDKRIASATGPAAESMRNNRAGLIKEGVANDLPFMSLPDELKQELGLGDSADVLHATQLHPAISGFFKHERRAREEERERKAEQEKAKDAKKPRPKPIHDLHRLIKRQAYLATIRTDHVAQEKPGWEGISNASSYHKAADPIGAQYAMIVKVDDAQRHKLKQWVNALQENDQAAEPRYYDGLLEPAEVKKILAPEVQQYTALKQLDIDIEQLQDAFRTSQYKADQYLESEETSRSADSLRDRESRWLPLMLQKMDEAAEELAHNGVATSWSDEARKEIKQRLSQPIDNRTLNDADIVHRSQSYHMAIDMLGSYQDRLRQHIRTQKRDRGDVIAELSGKLRDVRMKRQSGAPVSKEEKAVKDELRDAENIDQLIRNSDDYRGIRDEELANEWLPAMTQTKAMSSPIVSVDEDGNMLKWGSDKKQWSAKSGDQYVAIFLDEKTYETLKERNGFATLPKKNERKDWSEEGKQALAQKDKNPADHPEEAHLLKDWLNTIRMSAREVPTGRAA